jgi:hypothetical protein
MMLGPAYLHTMAAIFGAPDQPARVCAVAPNGARYEEHPPGHVRVVCAARLLGQMAYGKEGDDLERAWRQRHNQPDRLFFPATTGEWMAVADEPVIQRASAVGTALYATGLTALAGAPLRSIPGLDFGPREHARAKEVKAALAAGRRPMLRDPRLLIAGAVLAWYERTDDRARIYRVTRDCIEGISGEPRRAATAAEPAQADQPLDADVLRDAILLDLVLSPPPRLRR